MWDYDAYLERQADLYNSGDSDDEQDTYEDYINRMTNWSELQAEIDEYLLWK